MEGLVVNVGLAVWFTVLWVHTLTLVAGIIHVNNARMVVVMNYAAYAVIFLL